MLKKLTFAISGVLSLAVLAPSFAADKEAETPKKATKEAKPKSEVAKELQQIVADIRAKQKAGKKTEADFAEELKRFDDLLAKHKDEKTDEIASVAMTRAQIYTIVIKDAAKGKELLDQVAKDFPDTKAAAYVKKTQKSAEIQAKLVPGTAFPDFSVTGVDGQPLSISAYKGKVVLIDFWATWCAPCVAELPNVKKTYAKHHEEGFDIIGISLDADKVKLEGFLKKHEIPWRQFFDGKAWENELAEKYGVQAIPATYLLDTEGKIIGSGLRGEELEKAVEKALKKDTK
jgi:peroxiredoxin